MEDKQKKYASNVVDIPIISQRTKCNQCHGTDFCIVFHKKYGYLIVCEPCETAFGRIASIDNDY